MTAVGVLPAGICRDGRLSPRAKVLLLAIASHADRMRQAFPSVALLEQETGLDERSLRRAMQEAEDAGYLRRSRRGRGNLYTIIWPEETPDRHRTPVAGDTGHPWPVSIEQDQGTENSYPPEPYGSSPPETLTLVEVPQADPVRLVFEAWVASLRESGQGSSRRVLTDARRRAVRARLRDGYSPEDLAAAAVGWLRDPWPERPQHNDLTVLMKPGNVERMAEFARDGATTRMTPFQGLLRGGDPSRFMPKPTQETTT